MIPGLGTSVRPPLLDESYVDEVVLRRGGRHHPGLPPPGQTRIPVRRLHRHGGQRRDGLAGRSTTPRELTAVAIAPDLGERYLDTVYQTNWLQDLYGEDVLDSDDVAAGSWAASPAPPTRWGGSLDLQTGDHHGNQHHQFHDRKT